MATHFKESDTKSKSPSGLRKNFFTSSLSNLVEKRLSLKKKKSHPLSVAASDSNEASSRSSLDHHDDESYRAKIIAEYELEKTKSLKSTSTDSDHDHELESLHAESATTMMATESQPQPIPPALSVSLVDAPSIELIAPSPTPSSPSQSETFLITQMKGRSASMQWVDLLTEDGVQINGGEFADDEDDDQVEYVDKQQLIQSLDKRKNWFNKVGENEPEDIQEEEEKIISALYKKLRKESSTPSIRSRNTPEPDQQSTSSPPRYVDNLIFDMFMITDNGEEVVLIGTFLAALERTGLGRNDPRLVELFENLRRVRRQVELAGKPASSIETLKLDRDKFKTVITDNIVLISKAFRQQFVIPEFQAFCGYIEDMYNKCKDLKGGKVANSVPQLANVNPNFWGVSVCTVDGQRFSIGDTKNPFTIQCCSKPLAYAIALNELGEDLVHQYVGQEPSGRTFNELVLDYNKKPHNPMVNAGAIIVCSLLKQFVKPEMSLAEKFDYTYQYFKKLAGGEYIGFNNAVFLSGREAADRDYALGFYMRENKCFPEGTNLEECMDYYFQMCSMESNCESMSIMAATLANGGICPISGEKILNPDSVRDVLALMHSCGMVDYSGQFAFKVGLPCKSGLSGAIMLTVPNVLGMAVWSPPLDSLGNSVRGVALCQELVQVFNFHKYDNLKHASDKVDPRKHRYETKGMNIVNLLFSAASGDVTSMRRHHLSGMDMNAADYDGRTALHLAAAEGHLECVDYLLRQCHVKHNPVDRWGHHPIYDAEKFGHSYVADFLRKWEADYESENTESGSGEPAVGGMEVET